MLQMLKIKMDCLHGLFTLKTLIPIGPGVFRHDDLVFFAHPFLRRSLSRLNSLNSPFLVRLQQLAAAKLNVKIALDPDMVGLASSYSDYFEFEYWWGPKFTDDLTQIPVGIARHEAEEDQRLFHGISRTEFWWQSRDEQHIFEVEELRDIPTAPQGGSNYGCRYVHSIIDEAESYTKHFDGAIRMYTEDKMLERLDTNIRDAGRHSLYTKLWRIDGVIDTAAWKALLTDYFRDNQLVGEYLGATPEGFRDSLAAIDLPVVEPRQETVDETLTPMLQEYVPYSMSKGSGVRLALSFCPEPFASDIDLQVIATSTLTSNQDEIKSLSLKQSNYRKPCCD